MAAEEHRAYLRAALTVLDGQTTIDDLGEEDGPAHAETVPRPQPRG